MALSTRLELRQSQQLVMTPQLQQAIKLLQLSNLELGQFIEAELERNPLLEREEEASAPADGPEGFAEDSPDGPDAGDSTGEWAEPAVAGLDLAAAPADGGRELDADNASVDPDAGPGDFGPGMASDNWAGLRQSRVNDPGEADLEDTLTSRTSLKDHLAAQLPLVITDPVDRMAAAYLIDLVDDAGYARIDIGEIARQIGVDEARLERVLARLQTLDPPGVMARDLKECLAIQLRERGRYDAVVARFLDNLQLLAQHNLNGLKRAVGCDMDDLIDMISEVRALNPRPGSAFVGGEPESVVPDVIVRAAADGRWLIELNSDTLPRVLVNRSYYAMVAGRTSNQRDKEFLVDCLASANWLVKSLDQRARTILKVAEEIVRQQDGFLVHGVQHLRPLNLKTVADRIGMHESTVSRVTSSKYIATPRGIFEMKYFFNSAIPAAGDGEAHSSESVRHRIRQLVDAERPEAILSDDDIVEALGREGIEIARRTVAKYRDALRIPSSVQRRREKRAMLETKLAG